jgi:endoglucanase
MASSRRVRRPFLTVIIVIRAGDKLDRTPLGESNYFTSVFVAPFGVAAMTSASQQKWLDRIYAAVRLAREDYFEDSVNLLCLLVMTGNFWDPTLVR